MSDGSPDPPRGSPLARAVVAVYVAVQLLLPIPAWLAGIYQTEGQFSWNMYAHHYQCEWAYETAGPGSERAFLDPRPHVHDPRSISFFLHRDTLPRLHAWACREQVPPGGALAGRVRCRRHPDAFVELVRSDVDLCRAANFGVLGDAR